MKIIRRKWHGLDRASTFTLYPLGDVHLGNAACDERMFRQAVKRIEADDNALWVGLGDYCDFINRSDKRFAHKSLAKWLWNEDCLAEAQTDKFLDLIDPIAGKCLGLVEGNHERAIQKYYEWSPYHRIVRGVKKRGGFEADHRLAFGYSGWLMLHFYRSMKDAQGTLVKVYLHHGFVGGKLAGAKALNMQRILWNHECDLCIMGHSHNTMVQPEAIEKVRGSRVVKEIRKGIYSGTFMGNARYAEEKGYFPMPIIQPHVVLRPGAIEHRDRIRVVT